MVINVDSPAKEKKFEPLIKNGIPTVKDSLPLTFKTIYDPSLLSDFTVPYCCQARIRHVVHHQRTILESDDIISYAEGEISVGKSLKIISKENDLTRLWQIVDSSKNRYSNLMINDNLLSQGQPMYFESFGQAQNWLRWLKRMKKKNSTPFNNVRFQINLGEYKFHLPIPRRF